MFIIEHFTRSAHRSKTFSTALEVSFTNRQLPIKNMTELCVEVYELWWKWDFRFMFSEYRLVEEKGSCTFCKKKTLQQTWKKTNENMKSKPQTINPVVYYWRTNDLQFKMHPWLFHKWSKLYFCSSIYAKVSYLYI